MSKYVFRGDEAPRHRIRPDLFGTVMSGGNVTLVRWVIPSGAAATGFHSHEVHEQFTIVLSGSIETVVGEETLVLRAGDVCQIEPKVVHGGTRALGDKDAVLIDVFEPTRPEYVAAAAVVETTE